MGGASLYLWLTLLCVLLVLGLFGLGWILVRIGRRQEQQARERRILKHDDEEER